MDIPSTANPWLDLLAKVGAASLAVLAFFKRWKHRRQRLQLESEQRILDALENRTRPIQPGANGGESLSDAIRMLRVLQERQTIIQQSLLDHLQHHDNEDDRSK